LNNSQDFSEALRLLDVIGKQFCLNHEVSFDFLRSEQNSLKDRF